MGGGAAIESAGVLQIYTYDESARTLIPSVYWVASEHPSFGELRRLPVKLRFRLTLQKPRAPTAAPSSIPCQEAKIFGKLQRR